MSANRNQNEYEFGGNSGHFNANVPTNPGQPTPLKGVGMQLNGSYDGSAQSNSPRGSPKRAPPPANTSRNNAYQTGALQQAQLETVKKPQANGRNNAMLLKNTEQHVMQQSVNGKPIRNVQQQISSTTQRPLINTNNANQERLARSFNNNQVANGEQYPQTQHAASSLSGNVRNGASTNKNRYPPTEKKMKDEVKTSSGNIVANACGPLKKARYVNPKIEKELVEFKQEIEDKFAKSALRTFVFPKKREGLGMQRKPDLVNDLEGPYNRIKNGRAVAQSTDASLMQQYLQNIQINGKQPQGSGTKRNQQMKSKLNGGISSLGGGAMGPIINSQTGLSNQNLGVMMQSNVLSPQASYNFNGGLAGGGFNDQSNGLLSVINNPTKATSSTAEQPVQHHRNISMYAESQLGKPQQDKTKRTKPRDNSRLADNQRQQQSQRFNKNVPRNEGSTSREPMAQIVNIQRQNAEVVLNQQMETTAKKYIKQHQEDRSVKQQGTNGPSFTKNTFQDFYKHNPNESIRAQQQRLPGNQPPLMPKLPGSKMPGQHLRLDPIDGHGQGYNNQSQADAQFMNMINSTTAVQNNKHTRNRGAVAQSLNFAKGQLGAAGGPNIFAPVDAPQVGGSPERYNNSKVMQVNNFANQNQIGQATYNHRRNVQKATMNTSSAASDKLSPMGLHEREHTNNRILQNYNARGNGVTGINSGSGPQQPRQGRMQGHNRALAALQQDQSGSPGLPAVNQSMNISGAGSSPMQGSLVMQGNTNPVHQRNRNEAVSQSLMFPPALKGKKQL